MAHNFIKVWLLQTLAVTNDFDIICLTETFLGSSIENDDEYPYHDMIFCALAILVTQRGGICICFKKKKCFFTSFYRSPSQTSNEFEDFCTDLNLFLSNMSNDLNPACYIITGNFNVRFPQLWALDKENNKGREISFITSFLNLKIYILIHIRLCGKVSDKNFFTRPISGNNTIFWPY